MKKYFKNISVSLSKMKKANNPVFISFLEFHFHSLHL